MASACSSCELLTRQFHHWMYFQHSLEGRFCGWIVRFDQVANIIVNAEHDLAGSAVKVCVADCV
jgi:hypothetical protein